ncbi:hypothetical protein LCGC14_2551580, partial [marine sediment metagenome]
GNAIWKVAASGSDVKVGVDVGATAGFLGAASSDGVLRTGAGLTYTDGGDFVTLKPDLVGDGTAGRVIRVALLEILDGTNANTLKCILTSIWNGDAIGNTDNIAKGATTGGYLFSANGEVLTIEASAISGNTLFCIATLTYNASGVVCLVDVDIVANDIELKLRHATNGATQDITSLVDAGLFHVVLFYETDA